MTFSLAVYEFIFAIHQQPEFLPFSEHVNKINAHVELSREKMIITI